MKTASRAYAEATETGAHDGVACAAPAMIGGARDVRAARFEVTSRLPLTARRETLCIAFVDVAGFSSIMFSDEDDAYRRWSGLRDGVLLPALAEHGGALVKLTGDGILARFPDSVSGARWSREAQRRARAERQSLALRIALNLCSVIHDHGDLAGDGVNVAARLQEHAPEGGVIMTEAMKAALADRPDLPMRRIGALHLRKLPEPVVAWELLTDARAMASATRSPKDALAPAIAVLPFANIGGDASDDYLAAGLVEDIVVSLASYRDLSVISRASTLAFARQRVDLRTVGEVLGVRYVVTGTLRRSGRRLRVATELADAGTGENLFTQRRDIIEDDLFDLQDDIVDAAVARILPGLQAAERRRAMRKRPENFTAYDLTLRALDLIGSLEPEPFQEAYRYLDEAIALDPGYATALAWSARWHTLRVGQGWSDDTQKDQIEAATRAMRAIRLDEQNALALATYGHVQSYLFGDFETAIGYLDRAREAGPSNAHAWLLSSITLGSLGRTGEAREAGERALRLSPFDPHLFIYYSFLGVAEYDCGDFEAAIGWLYRALAENPRYTSTLRSLAVSLVAAGRDEEARRVMRQLLDVAPDFRMSRYVSALRLYSEASRIDAFHARLRRAGAPE